MKARRHALGPSLSGLTLDESAARFACDLARWNGEWRAAEMLKCSVTTLGKVTAGAKVRSDVARRIAARIRELKESYK